MKEIDKSRKKNLELSNFNLYPAGHEQMFTELTSSEAALIVGGGLLEFANIDILESKAKNLCLNVNGREVWSASIPEGRRVLPIAKEGDFPVRVGYTLSAVVDLYENCGEETVGTRVGRFWITTGAVAKETIELKRDDDSIYRLTYRVFEP